MAKIRLEMAEKDLKTMVLNWFKYRLQLPEIKESDVQIETKSSQNYRSTWEGGAGFRAVAEINIEGR